MSSTDRPKTPAFALLLVVAVVAGLFGVAQAGNSVDITNRALKSIDSREAADLSRLRRDFGEDRSLLLAFSSRSGLALTSTELEAVGAAEQALRRRSDEVDGVVRFRSPDPSIAGLLVDLRLLEEGAGADQSEDAASVGSPAVDASEAIVASLKSECPPTLSLHATSPQLGEKAIAEALSSERGRIMPSVTLTLIALLWLIYRRFLVALIVLAAPGATIVVTGGLFALAGHRLDPVATLLDPVLLTVGVASGVHLLEAFARARRHSSPRVAVAVVRNELRSPVLWSSATTMVGFLALTLTDLPAVATFGGYAAFGVALVFCLSFWCVPVWLAAFAPSVTIARPMRRAWIGHVGWLGRRRVAILALALVGFALTLGGLTRLRVDNDPLRLIGDSASFRQEYDWFVDRLGGVETVGLLVPAESPAMAPDRLALLGADLVGREGILGFARSPRRSAGGDVLLSALLAPSGSAARSRLFDSIEEHAADFGFPGVRVVGTAVQIARDSERLVRGQLLGLSLVIPLLGLTVALGLRSWRLGLLSLVPNAAPMAALYGLLAWIDRPLSVATVMIGSAMMGLVIDDTIHLLHNHAASLRAGRSPTRALRAALDRAGRPISVTSLVLAFGLGVGVIGSLESTIEFSALAAGTVLLAWLLDLVILPAILIAFPFWSRVRSSDLPEDSSHGASNPDLAPCPTPSTH